MPRTVRCHPVRLAVAGGLAALMACVPVIAAPGGKPDKRPPGAAAGAHGRGSDHAHGAEHGAPHTGDRAADWQRDWQIGDFLAAGFSAAVLHELAAGTPGALSPGARPLPPGIAKNLARGKPLPPGLATRQAGPALTGVLPRVTGYEWRRAGVDLVLVEAGSRIVAEIIRDALR